MATLNERRLREKGLTEAQQAIQVLSRTLNQYDLVSEQGREVLRRLSAVMRNPGFFFRNTMRISWRRLSRCSQPISL